MCANKIQTWTSAWSSKVLSIQSLRSQRQRMLNGVLAGEGFTDVELVEYLGGASAIHFARKPGPG